MKYTDFIREFSVMLNENGIRITQPKLKELFNLLGDYVADNIKEEGQIPLKEFLSFELVVISPKKLPNGSLSDEQLSVKIKMSDKYKKQLKDKLNNK
jgi:nucleoid DNA-binding protein